MVFSFFPISYFFFLLFLHFPSSLPPLPPSLLPFFPPTLLPFLVFSPSFPLFLLHPLPSWPRCPDLNILFSDLDWIQVLVASLLVLFSISKGTFFFFNISLAWGLLQVFVRFCMGSLFHPQLYYLPNSRNMEGAVLGATKRTKIYRTWFPPQETDRIISDRTYIQITSLRSRLNSNKWKVRINSLDVALSAWRIQLYK